MQPRLRISNQSILVRRGGRMVRQQSTTVSAPANAARSIDAEVIHGDEQVFWGERRTWYRYRRFSSYVPSWDRFAQALLLVTRAVPRVPQEAAFRILAVFLKLMMMPTLTHAAGMMLPLWASLNPQALLEEAKSKAAQPADSTAPPEPPKQ